ncbi:MAG: bifunctional hydroxymethylpyrimidine kinase/phosphomethylpyrimidine kinase [Janthinobacterium lividum]
MSDTIFNVLTIAGSDSGGGAGIQADLKTFSAFGVYGASVVTALTAQNTRGVQALHVPDASFVSAQMDAVFDDIRIDAVKLGMLANAAIIKAVAGRLAHYAPRCVVLDTVMIAKSGHALLEALAVRTLVEELLPQATVITPNLPEAAALLGVPMATDEASMVEQAEALRALGARNVLIKGGHLQSSESPDWLIGEQTSLRLGAARQPVTATHGTGCTLSAAIAAAWPRSQDLTSAVSAAKQYVSEAIAAAPRLSVGGGIGPLHHFHAWW